MTLLTERRSIARAPWKMAALLVAVREEFRRRRVYRTTLRQLRGLSQRDLDDLGIARHMISRLAAEAAWGKKD
jgi:uncharacterized protein YjiS (DUF1127 family)